MQAALQQEPALRRRVHRSTEADLCWIASQLGLLHHQPRTIIKKIRLLVEGSGFPLPKNPRFVNGIRMTGASSIDAFSVWERDPVELWLDNDRPPAESAALVAARRQTVRHELRQRGLMLVASNG